MKIVLGVVSFLAGWLVATGAAIALMVVGLNIPRALARTYSEYSTFQGAQVLILTIIFSVLVYQAVGRRVFQWAPDTRPWSERIPRWASHPSGLGLVIAWIAGVFTGIGYLVAIYMSWRYYVGWRDGQKQCPRCAERVKAVATMCRHCQFDFSALPGSAAGTP